MILLGITLANQLFPLAIYPLVLAAFVAVAFGWRGAVKARSNAIAGGCALLAPSPSAGAEL